MGKNNIIVVCIIVGLLFGIQSLHENYTNNNELFSVLTTDLKPVLKFDKMAHRALINNIYNSPLKDNQVDKLVIKRLCKDVNILCPKIKKVTLKSGNVSQTVNKRDIKICIRDPNTKQLYDYDILLSVLIHELTHVISKTYIKKNHDKTFWDLYTKLMNKAKTIGLLPKHPIEVPQNYCIDQNEKGYFD